MAAAMAMVAVGPASAEPINTKGKPVIPAQYDIVGVGSESIFAVTDQLTFNYNKTVTKHSPKNPWIQSWDAVPPSNLNNTTQQIVLKTGCAKALRPNGSGAGITALTTYGNTRYKGKTYHCIDFARSSRPRKTTDPAFAPGGVAFVVLAGDAVTYASTNLKGESTNVPNNLTLPQLQAIFGCSVLAANGDPANSWGALLGNKVKAPKALFNPILPQAGSGTLSFWATTVLKLSGTTEPTCGAAASLSTAKQPEENEGTNAIFKKGGKPDPNAIYPFSIGSYVAQQFHSKTCGKSPKRGQNQFGCNQIGVLGLNGIRVGSKNIAPTTPVKGGAVTNSKWTGTIFHRTLYDVVRFNTVANPIPSYLHKWIGPKGYFCKQSAVIKAYGFEPSIFCGAAS
jgi:ABC-type phosphate transport system substrate-binding protein